MVIALVVAGCWVLGGCWLFAVIVVARKLSVGAFGSTLSVSLGGLCACRPFKRVGKLATP